MGVAAAPQRLRESFAHAMQSFARTLPVVAWHPSRYSAELISDSGWSSYMHSSDVCASTMDVCASTMDVCASTMDVCASTMDVCASTMDVRASTAGGQKQNI